MNQSINRKKEEGRKKKERKKEGRKEGRKKGRKEGRKERRKEILYIKYSKTDKERKEGRERMIQKKKEKDSELFNCMYIYIVCPTDSCIKVGNNVAFVGELYWSP